MDFGGCFAAEEGMGRKDWEEEGMNKGGKMKRRVD